MLNHIVHPIVLMCGAAKPRGARLLPADASALARLPEQLRDHLRRGTATLAERGFQPPTYVTSSEIRRAFTLIALLEHSEAGTIGMSMVVVPESGVFKTMGAFTNRFDDGWKLVTTNSTTTLRTPPLPRVDGARFLGVGDVGALYKIHCARVAERSKISHVMPMGRGNDPIGFQVREAREVHDFWVSAGYYRYVGADEMVLTPRGAALAAWRGLFPWKLISSVAADRKARSIAQRLGFRYPVAGM